MIKELDASDIRAKFLSPDDGYAPRREAAEARIANWAWATAVYFDPRPLHFERHGWAPGKRMKVRPANVSHHVQCGVDVNGDILVERKYPGFDETHFYERFFAYGLEQVEAVSFSQHPDGKFITNITQVDLQNGRPARSVAIGAAGLSEEVYKYSRQRVERLDFFHHEGIGSDVVEMELWNAIRADYSEDGKLQRVRRQWPVRSSSPPGSKASSEIVFERRGTRIYRHS